MRKIITLTLALMTFGGVARAQEGFTKQIEVQKEYEVVVRSAERIESDVPLLDTTIVRPELTYRIRPTAHITNFTVAPLRPAVLSTAQWKAPRRLYLNVGAGVPWQSEADVYWTPVQTSRSMLAVWLNHEGVLGAKVENYDGERVSALALRNKAGVGYSTLLGKRTSLTTAFNYRGTVGNAYGGVGVGEGNRPTVSVHDVELKANLAGDFGEKSTLAYDANAMGLYALNGAGEDVWRFNFNFGLLGLDRIKGWLPNRVTLHYSGVQSRCIEPLDDYYDTSVTFVPEWSLRIGRWIPVEVMVGYDHMIYKGAKNSLNGVIASLSTRYERYPFAVPYLTVANDVQTKVTRDGLWENPYQRMLPVDSRKVFLAEVGVKGSASRLTYKLSGATRWFSTYLFERIVEGEPLLGYGRSEGQRVWYADAEVAWHANQRFTVEGRVNFLSLGRAESATAEYRPRKWSIGGEAQWKPLAKLTLTTRCLWRSAMGVTKSTSDLRATLIEMPSYIDLGVEALWQHSERVGVWLRGDNLLNEPIYHWATYRSLGIGVRGGVSIAF